MNNTQFDVITHDTLDALLAKAFSAWNANDGKTLATCCTEDVEWLDAAAPNALRGRAAVAEFAGWFFQVLPDGRFERPGPPAVSSDGRTAYQPWRLTGTNTGPINPPGFVATGRPVDLLGVDQYRLRGGLIARYQAFYDRVELMNQLGLLPLPRSRGERVMVVVQRIGQWLQR